MQFVDPDYFRKFLNKKNKRLFRIDKKNNTSEKSNHVPESTE